MTARSLRVAVLIADARAEEFQDIKSTFHPQLWTFENTHDISVFYVKGREAKPTEKILNLLTDKLRYTKLWPLQNVFDRIELRKYSHPKANVVCEGSEIQINTPEGLRYLGAEMLAAYQFLFSCGFDLIFRTTLSTVVNPRSFMAVLNTIPMDRPFYGGNIVNFGGHPFVSGANTYLNSHCGELISRLSSTWNHGFLDDVALGRILEKWVIPSQVDSLNVSNISEVNQLTDLEVLNTPTFRCRTFTKPRTDVAVMREMQSRISDLTD